MRMITIANNLKWNNYRGAKAVDIINDALGLNDNGFVVRELYYKVNAIINNKYVAGFKLSLSRYDILYKY